MKARTVIDIACSLCDYRLSFDTGAVYTDEKTARDAAEEQHWDVTVGACSECSKETTHA